jgi:hypothetical protein
MNDAWLTGMIGYQSAADREAEIKAILDTLDYAKERLDSSNYDCGNLDKVIDLVKQQQSRS